MSTLLIKNYKGLIKMNNKNYKIGDIVTNIIELESECGDLIPIGTQLKIVAIAPKVRMIKKDNIYHDGFDNFYNAILASQTEPDYINRIRYDFCTIKKA